jgi:glycerol-3-phosphate acyltransferase PlsY
MNPEYSALIFNWGMLYIIIATITAYLLGSIPTAVWVSRFYFNKDIRQHGSGNAGATNTFRVLGKSAGALVMVVDVLKGWLATMLAEGLVLFEIVSYDEFLIYKIIFYKLLFGMVAVLGHIFPIFASFRGGKGVATLLGMMLAVHATITLMCVGVFVIVLLMSRYVSLGSMLATLAFPLLLLIPRFKPEEDAPVLIAFGFLMFIVIVLTHQKNVIKLLNGEESRTYIRLKRRG